LAQERSAISTPVALGIAAGAGVVLYVAHRLLFGGVRKGPIFLNKSRQRVVLAERTMLSHDTIRFRFALPHANSVLGLPVGKHFKLFAPNPAGTVKGAWNGRDDPEAGEHEIERKYTPSSSDHELGYCELVIKVYERGKVDRFPDGGKMSQYMASLKIGDAMTISGPWGSNEYKGHGHFKIGARDKRVKHVGMMSGGTGITPMLQVIAAILRDRSDQTKVSLLYANQSEDDILVRDMLEALKAAHPDRFVSLWYTLDRPPAGWKYSAGFITEAMIAAHLPAPGPDTLVLMCGPPPMVKFACQANLDKLGYAKDSQVAF
jgi:cytochrome-b5 reductase